MSLRLMQIREMNKNFKIKKNKSLEIFFYCHDLSATSNRNDYWIFYMNAGLCLRRYNWFL